MGNHFKWGDESMNIERSLISCLTLLGEKSGGFFDYNLRESSFHEYRREYAYTLDHYRKHGCFPTRAALKRAYPGFVFINTKSPLSYYCEEIKKREVHNRLAEVVEQVGGKLREGEDPLGSVSILRKEMLKLSYDFLSSKDVDWAQQGLARLRDYNQRKITKGITGIRSGWNMLDSATGGWQKQQFIVITGLHYSGKSWVLLNMLVAAWRQGYRPLFISKEMSEEEVSRRIDSLLCHLPWEKFRKGELGRYQELKYRVYLKKLLTIDRPIYISDEETIEKSGVLNIAAKIQEYKPDIVFVDGAYLLSDDEGAKGKVEQLFNVSQSLKRQAKACEVPIIASVQRGKEAGGTQWASALKQDPDVLFEVRGEPESSTRNLVGLKIREGRLVDEIIKFDFSAMNFASVGAATVSENELISADYK